MKNQSWMALLPSLLISLGILAATKVAVLTTGSLELVMAGPLLMAGAIVAAGTLKQRLGLTPGRTIRAAWVTGGIVVLTSAIIAFRDPARVAEALPILGAAGLFVAIDERGSARRCRRRAEQV